MVPLVGADDARGVSVLLAIGELVPLLVVVVCDAATREVDVGAGLLDCTGPVLGDVVWAVLLLAGAVLVATAGVSDVDVELAG